MTLKEAIKEIFSEPGPSGTLSWGRVAATLTLFAGIAWVSHLVFKFHSIPPLGDVTIFSLSPYGANKAITAVQSFSANPVNR